MAIDRDGVVLYAATMNEVWSRLSAARDFVGGAATWPRLESAALQLRTIIELISLAALVPHSALAEQVAEAFRRRDAEKAAKLLESINPGYWPIPVCVGTSSESPSHRQITFKTGDYLRRSDWRKEWGRLSSWLHVRGPYRPRTPGETIGSLQNLVTNLLDRVDALLSVHMIALPDGEEHLLAQISGPPEGSCVEIVEGPRPDGWFPAPDV